MLSIFNRKSGWGDCVDRFPGHPQSIDALVALTSDVILTGSSDGLVRAVQILPSKFLGAVADHGEFPIERLALDRRKKWLASASHDELFKLTDVQDALEESDADEEQDAASDAPAPEPAPVEEDSDADSDEPVEQEKKKKRKKKGKQKDGSGKRANAGDGAFFSEL